jgi:hypothetical protein
MVLPLNGLLALRLSASASQRLDNGNSGRF